MVKIHDEILLLRDSEKLPEIFFNKVYPPKIYLTKLFVANVLPFSDTTEAPYSEDPNWMGMIIYLAQLVQSTWGSKFQGMAVCGYYTK